MKKIIIGILIMLAAPFTVLIGGWIISQLYVSDGIKVFACIIGGASIIFNVVIGALIIVSGHKDIKTLTV